MIDITTTRTVAGYTHSPALIFAMLAGLARSQARSGIHILAFAAVLTLTVCVILDYEFPRLGFIRINPVDQVLMDVRAQME